MPAPPPPRPLPPRPLSPLLALSRPPFEPSRVFTLACGQRRMHDLALLHSYHADAGAAGSSPRPPPAVCALSLCAENHHTFVGTEDGGLRILANPIVNIQVLEAIAASLLNL